MNTPWRKRRKLGSYNGRSVHVAIEKYKARFRERMVSKAKDLAEFRQLWIEARERKSFILNPAIE